MSRAMAVSSLNLIRPVSCRQARTQSKGNTKTGRSNGGPVEGFGGGGGGGKPKEQLWQCVKGCGACCKLNKGPDFATPEEIFASPSDIQLYRSLIGPDGWCIHFDKSSRTCSIYSGEQKLGTSCSFYPAALSQTRKTKMDMSILVDRPYFCRVQPDIFQTLYGIDKRKFNKEACSFCKDTIKAIYGAHSEELVKFNRAIRSHDAST
ncbi:hypothetical protein Ancab_017539 [Ancistrocladus abbreviatus]